MKRILAVAALATLIAAPAFAQQADQSQNNTPRYSQRGDARSANNPGNGYDLYQGDRFLGTDSNPSAHPRPGVDYEYHHDGY
jgi:opacity protein-like surface antigen